MKCARCGYEQDPEEIKRELMTRDPSYIKIWVCPKCKKTHFIRLEVETYPVGDELFRETKYGRFLIGGTLYKDHEVVLDKEYKEEGTRIINGKEIHYIKSEKPDIEPGSQTNNE